MGTHMVEFPNQVKTSSSNKKDMSSPMYTYAQILSELILMLFFVFSNSHAQGQVSDVSELTPFAIARVTDGDTVVSSEGDRIRLWGVDAPEISQPYGKEATIALTELIEGKNLAIEIVDVDRYGRGVGRIYMADGTNINRSLVCMGAAWWYEEYAPRAYDLRNCELEAKSQKIGLWSLAEPLNPSEWRRGERSKKNAEERLASFTCGEKRVCRQMISCEEAEYHLKECGQERLDGDKDGIPCESICK